MDVLTEPGGDGGDVALGDVIGDGADVGFHHMLHLGTVGAAQGVGGEVADGAAGPVAVLEAALGIVGHIHAQVLLVQPVPLGGHVLDLQGAVHELLLHLIADHDVQGIGQLVGLGADEGGLGLVGGTVQVVGGDVFQLLGEELLHLREDQLDELQAPADEILIKPGLTLVDAHAGTAAQAGAVVLGVHAQIVQGMTALVDGGEDGEGGIVLVVMGGDSGVIGVEAQGEGVLALGDGAAVGVQADGVHQILGELLLALDGVALVQEGGVGHGLFGDGLDQGDDDLPQLGEEAVQRLHGQTLLKFVEQRIVGQLGGIVVAGELLVVGHDLLQNGSEGGEIVLLLGHTPDALGLVQQHVEGDVLVLGDAGQLLAALLLDLHHAAVVCIQLAFMLGQIGKKLPGVLGGSQVIDHLAQDRHGLAPAFGSAQGGGGGGIQAQCAHGVGVGGGGGLDLIEPGDGIVDIGIRHRRCSFVVVFGYYSTVCRSRQICCRIPRTGREEIGYGG